MYVQVLTAKGVKWQTRFAVLTSDRISFATQPTNEHLHLGSVSRNGGSFSKNGGLSHKELRVIFDRNVAGSEDG